MKRIAYIAFFLSFCLITKAQKDSILKAQSLYTAKAYSEALVAINSVVSSKNAEDLEQAYLLQVFILKDYAKVSNPQQSHIFRSIALEVIEKLYQMKTSADIKSLAKYLSQTFNNDAVQSITNNKLDIAESQFGKYMIAAQYCMNPSEIKNRQIDFKNAMATAYYNNFMSATVKTEADFKKAELAYKAVLELDPENITANYSIAVLYYNLAVDYITNINPDETDLEKISALQDKMSPLFRQSQPYFEKANNLAPERTDVLQGLKYVYYNLNVVDKLKDVEDKLKKLGTK